MFVIYWNGYGQNKCNSIEKLHLDYEYEEGATQDQVIEAITYFFANWIVNYSHVKHIVVCEKDTDKQIAEYFLPDCIENFEFNPYKPLINSKPILEI